MDVLFDVLAGCTCDSEQAEQLLHWLDVRRGFGIAAASQIRALCDAGHGTWLTPAAGAHRPATHLHEIHLFNIIGTGETEAEAARSWQIAARRFTQKEAA
jgi:hypothetical protein